jgi:hypothetical protein
MEDEDDDSVNGGDAAMNKLAGAETQGKDVGKIDCT